MNSQRRKENIKLRLKRGDLKQLSERLKMSYSYLSQTFSPGSSFNFTEALARKVEEAMGWQQGILDDTSKVEFNNSHEYRRSRLFVMAIHFRAGQLAKHYPFKKVITAYPVELDNIRKQADIAVLNADESVFAVGMQCDDHKRDDLAEEIILMMALSGARYGFLYTNDSGMDPSLEGTIGYYPENRQSRWFQFVDGKVNPIDFGPDDIYASAGI